MGGKYWLRQAKRKRASFLVVAKKRAAQCARRKRKPAPESLRVPV
jgi:hypothetical protein